MEARPGLGWAVGVSTVVHLLALVLMARLPRLAPLPVPSRTELIPIALIGKPGGGNGGGAPPRQEAAVAPTPPAPAAVVQPPVPAPVPTRVPKAVVNRPKPTPKPRAEPAPAVARTAPSVAPPAAVPGRADGVPGGQGTGTAGSGTGSGPAGSGGGRGGGSGGGEGSGDARVAYAANPRPEYPVVARRMGMEGIVLLSVLVRSDGSVGDIDVQQSSGFPQLDDAALRTVRGRWRFVPARKAGTAIDARVTVPIRFRLSDES